MNAVIYARYSNGPNQTDQSIEGQLRLCHEYAERNELQVVGEYIDRAISGRSDERPEFQRMISDARHKQFERVIIYKLDRFARNLYDFVSYEHGLKKYGVTVVSAMENIGDNPESVMLKALLASSAEYYSLELSQKIKRGRVDGARKGKFLGGGIPTGYKADGGALVLDDFAAPLMKWAFEQYAAGMTKKEIVDTLNTRGLRNSHGKPFGYTAFQRAFQCEKYIGVLDQSGVRIEGGCPALIDKETFDRVQQRIAMRKHKPAMAKAKVEYLLSGKLYCGMCGAPMLGVSGTGKHGESHYYYVCGGRKRLRNCTKKNEKKDFLEWYCTAQTVEYVLTSPRIEAIAEAIVAEYENQFGVKQIRDLERRIAKLDHDMGKYTESLLDAPKAARKKIYEKIEEADAEKGDLEVDLYKLRVANGIHYSKAEIMAWLKQFCNGDPMDHEFRRRIIDVFINSIYLYDDKIVIFFNIRGGKQVSYIDMLDATEEPGEEAPSPEASAGSYIKALSPPHAFKSEPRFVFVNGLFGIVCERR